MPAPRLNWTGCGPFAPGADCATADLPLDYDEPNGPTTRVAVLRVKATDQAHRIGTLFVNPGGPAGSGTRFAATAPTFLRPEVLARFDIVGFDPRGTQFSDNVRCWPSAGGRDAALAGLGVVFPRTVEETAAYLTAVKAFGRACSTSGAPLSRSMSTAEVARDMDVLRRAVGDKQLTYFGISYGSYLGQVYANLFPDRVRALAIDAILDPVALVGTPGRGSTPSSVRLKQAEATARALHELLVRCRTAGPDRCSLAATGDPVASYEAILAALKKAPLTFDDPSTGTTTTVTYPQALSGLQLLLSTTEGVDSIADILTWASTLQNAAAPSSRREAAAAALNRAVAQLRSQPTPDPTTAPWPTSPYGNDIEARHTVICTDGLHPARADQWPAAADAADARVPGFGRLAAWEDAPCASTTWTTSDEDAYRGPFTHRTTNPVLIIGNYWDPVTNYDNAVALSKLLPNSTLVSVDSWGHTAFTRSACLDTAIENYLVTTAPPARGTHCVGDYQPFTKR
ncbi:MAG TPA: alpha/beta fold hydrolase [Kineosporiaceae bacterium]|nr:alpha/beta fold hydrolase [Kineosporiaceae bacterium]